MARSHSFESPAPPLFHRKISSALLLFFYCALAIFLMIADGRFQIAQTLRVGISAVIQPLQWALLQPIDWLRASQQYSVGLKESQDRNRKLELELLTAGQRGFQAEQLLLENNHLRKLLELRARQLPNGQVAEVLYTAADPDTHKVIVDKGFLSGIELGAPVIDTSGVLGQITQVSASTSEVTLLTDRSYSISLLNVRTGQRHVANGQPDKNFGGVELRFVSTNSDIQKGDVLTTSGIDGVYPAGLPVARVTTIERRSDTGFFRIYCETFSAIGGPSQVLLLKPVGFDAANSANLTSAPSAANTASAANAVNAANAAKVPTRKPPPLRPSSQASGAALEAEASSAPSPAVER